MIHDKVNIILCQKGEDYYFQRLILANTLFAAEIIMMRYFSTTASYALLENYLITEPFLVRIFPYFPVFSPNARRYGPEKLRIWTLFMQ